MRRIAFSRCKPKCLQLHGRWVLNGAARRRIQRRIGKPGPASTSKTRVQREAVNVLTQSNKDGEAEMARWRDDEDGRVSQALKRGWAGLLKRKSEGMAKDGGGCSLRRCECQEPGTGYTSATHLAPPVFDPGRSGLARSVTIISQLRSKAAKQLIPPQHPIDALFPWGNAWASPRLSFQAGLQIGWAYQCSTLTIQPARGKQFSPAGCTALGNRLRFGFPV